MSLDVEVQDGLPEGLGAIGIPVILGPDGPVPLSGMSPESLPLPVGLFGGDFDFSKRNFTGATNQVFVLPNVPEAGGADVVVLGFGSIGDRGPSTERWRRAAAGFVRAVPSVGRAALFVPVGADALEVGQAICEGAVLATYRFEEQRATKRPVLDSLVLIPTSTEDSSQSSGRAAFENIVAGVERGRKTADAVMWARDLINCPPSQLPPIRLVERVVARLAESPHTTVEVWDENRIAEERLGGLLGVSRGSPEPPRFVRAIYDPGVTAGGGELPHVVLVGKGITFDSGGLSLKTSDGMVWMKTDMTGAAVVLATLSACAVLGLPVRVTALAPIAENMPGGAGFKPGDVLTIRNGATIEVLNTDAEGRLILADGLSLAAEIDPPPDAVVDVATLTGAAVVALGTGMGALFASDPTLLARVEEAAKRSGERLWPMPMPEEYADHIDSDIADMKNTGKGTQAGAISAAMLLARFTGGLPWAHLDIAGPGRSSDASGYLAKGGTAFGIRTLVDLVESFVTSDEPSDRVGGKGTS